MDTVGVKTSRELPAPPDWGGARSFGMREVIAAVEADRPPPADGGLTLIRADGRPGVFGFAGHHVVAADVDPEWVWQQVPPGDLSVPSSAQFLIALGRQIGRRPENVEMMIMAPRLVERPPAPPLVQVGPEDHPLVARAHRYREDVRAWGTAGGVIAIGRGVGGRCEMTLAVAPEHRRHGLGFALAMMARYLVPDDMLWAQVSPGNPTVVRGAVRAGFAAVGAEVLLMP